MTLRRSLAAQGGLLAASLVFSLVLSTRLPETVATHWGLNGEPNGWGSKWTLLLLMPALQVFQAGLTVFLPLISPREGRIDRFGRTYAWIMLLVAALFTGFHALFVLKAAGANLDVTRTCLALLFFVWIPLGNVLGKVRRNYFVGIRTPWTLANEQVWNATHRAAGRLWVAGGTLGMLLALAGVPTHPLFLLLLAICLVPIAQSYLIYRRLVG